MSEEEIVAPVDTPPKDGIWTGWKGSDITEQEADEGNRLGLSIDVEDDNDNGGVE